MPLKVPAFTYHGFFTGPGVPSGIPPRERRYFLSRDVFGRHLDFLQQRGLRALALEEWLRFSDDADPAVLLTFDDGHISNYDLIWPMLAERGFKAIFFIVSNWVGQSQRITPAQLRELHAGGISIGSHGTSHTPLNRLDPQSLLEDLKSSKVALEDLLGAPVRSFAVPGGFMVDNLQSYAREAGYDHVFTSIPGWAVPGFPVSRISITNATPQLTLERLALGDPAQMRRMRLLYKLRQVSKRIVGVGGYEMIYRRLVVNRDL